jgi:hypothetical protein
VEVIVVPAGSAAPGGDWTLLFADETGSIYATGK